MPRPSSAIYNIIHLNSNLLFASGFDTGSFRGRGTFAGLVLIRSLLLLLYALAEND
jgi:hypothetical protein